VGEIREPPALGSAIQPQDRIVAVNGNAITMHTTHDDAVQMVVTAAAKGPVRFTLARVTAPGQLPTSYGQTLAALTPPFYVRAACEWPSGVCHFTRFPNESVASTGVGPLPFDSGDVLEVVGTNPFGDGSPQDNGRWWRARMIEKSNKVTTVQGGEGPAADAAAAAAVEGVIPRAAWLEKEATFSEEHREYTRAARMQQRISAGANALPLSYQLVVRVDAEAYRSALGARPVCLFGPRTLVDLVAEELIAGTGAHGIDFVRPLLAVTRQPHPGEVSRTNKKRRNALTTTVYVSAFAVLFPPPPPPPPPPLTTVNTTTAAATTHHHHDHHSSRSSNPTIHLPTHQISGKDRIFITHDEALRQIELGEMFVVGEELTPSATDSTVTAIRGLPVQSILGPAAKGHTVVLRESDGASMTTLSHLAQRTGHQPIIIFLDPAKPTTSLLSARGQGHDHHDAARDTTVLSGSGGDDTTSTLVDLCAEFDGEADPGLAHTRADAEGDCLVYGHLFTAVVNCNHASSVVVDEVVCVVREETTGAFWGMQSYVLPRGLVGQHPTPSVGQLEGVDAIKRVVTLDLRGAEDEGNTRAPPFTTFGKYWLTSEWSHNIKSL
jgi:hypothetical protein